MKRILVALLLTISVAFGQNAARYPTSLATLQDLSVAKDAPNRSTLNGAITNGATTAVVLDGSVFRAYNIVMFADNGEQAMICSISTNTLTLCARGFGGTTAAAHGSGIGVLGNMMAWPTNQIAAEVIAMQGALGAGMSRVASNTYVQSRGMNLVTNGSGLIGSNYNFTNFTFDQSDTYGGKGSFKNSTYGVTVESDEYIPVDGTRTYKQSIWAKSTVHAAGAHAYLGIVPYDVENMPIAPATYMRAWGTDTTLASTLTPGDTVVHLTSGANWLNGNDLWSLHHIQIWDYTNGFGFKWPAYTYTRHSSFNYAPYQGGTGTWPAGGVVGNDITLTAPWPSSLGTIPAGTAVSNGVDGNSFKYISALSVDIPGSWTNYTGTIGGWDTTGAGNGNQFPYGTANVRFLFLLNGDVAGNTTNFSNLWFSELTSTNLEPASASLPGVISLSDQVMGAGNKTFIGNVQVFKSDVTNELFNVLNPGQLGGANNTVFIHTDQTYNVGSTPYTGAALEVTAYANNTANNSGDTLRVGTSLGNGGDFIPQLIVKAATGNVGIGTVSPTEKLHVMGNEVLQRAAGLAIGSIVASLDFRGYTGYATPNAAAIASYIPAGSPGVDVQDLRFYTSQGGTDRRVERLRIAPNGNVGINEVTPSALLHITKTGVGTGLPIIKLGNGNNTVALGTAEVTSDADMLFYTQSTTERMRIKGNGNVGIGTTSPATALDVSGTITATQFNGSGAGLTSVPAQTWASITGKPTAVSAWTNDAGYLTSIPAQSWSSITGKPTIPTLVSQLTNDSVYITAAGAAASAGQWTGSHQINFAYGGDPSNAVPSVTVNNVWVNELLTTATLTSVRCSTDTGTATLQIMRSDGTAMMTSTLTCSTTGVSTTSFSTSTVSNLAGVGFTLSGTPSANNISVSIKYTPTY